MVYQIPKPGNIIPAQKAATPRFLEAAIAQQAQANALRQAKETERGNNLEAAIGIIGSAGGEGGWMQELGGLFGEGEMPKKDIIAQEGNQALPEGQMLASEDDMGDKESLGALASAASLASGNPMGLIGLKKLFEEFV